MNGNEDFQSMRKQQFFKNLSSHGIYLDVPDSEGMIPYLYLIKSNEFKTANQILKQGTNINHMSKNGTFALKSVFLNHSFEEFKKFIQKSRQLTNKTIDINKEDNKGRNLLHFAMNNSTDSIESSFDSHAFLIEQGVDINHQDKHLRTPLHYAYKKFAKKDVKATLDPIEIVSNFVALPNLKLDLEDKYKKTPLHYAC